MTERHPDSSSVCLRLLSTSLKQHLKEIMGINLDRYIFQNYRKKKLTADLCWKNWRHQHLDKDESWFFKIAPFNVFGACTNCKSILYLEELSYICFLLCTHLQGKKRRFQRILNAKIQFIEILMNKTQSMAKNSFPSFFFFPCHTFFLFTLQLFLCFLFKPD